MDTYPLIAQLLRCPVDLNLKQQKEYMIALFDQIDADGGNSIDRDEWTTFFCPDRCPRTSTRTLNAMTQGSPTHPPPFRLFPLLAAK